MTPWLCSVDFSALVCPKDDSAMNADEFPQAILLIHCNRKCNGAGVLSTSAAKGFTPVVLLNAAAC